MCEWNSSKQRDTGIAILDLKEFHSLKMFLEEACLKKHLIEGICHAKTDGYPLWFQMPRNDDCFLE